MVHPVTTRSGGRQPQFVVLGAQKSASTFLQDQLQLHPRVHLAPGEVRAFEEPYYSDGAADRLPELFAGVADDVVVGIKRPDYLGRPEIPARLHRHLPDAHLLAVVREPVDRAVSSYFHFVRHGFVPLTGIDEAFTALLEGSWTDRYPRSAEVLAYGRYGEHLTRYLEHFPAGQMLVLEQRQLIEDRDGCLARALELLGVTGDVPAPGGPRVSNKGVYAPTRLRLLRTKNPHRYRYAADLSRREPRQMTLWGRAYNAGVVGLDRMVLSRFDDGRPPRLSPAVRAAVEDYYRDDAATLRELLPLWSTPAPWLETHRD